MPVALFALLVLLIVLAPAPPAAADGGPWGWPLAGPHQVSRPFAPPASRYGAGHRGADLPGEPGAAVRASAAGRVTYAGQLAGRGVVVVAHGGLRTTYEPVAAAVPLGTAVSLGQVVGTLQAGHAGCPAAACLHWGLRRGQDYLDPVRLVERGPLRLLPLPLPALGDAPPAPALRVPVASAAAPADPDPVAPRAADVDEPSWSLRAAEAPLGAAAVVALMLGVGLLWRPRPLPPGPVSGGVPTPAAAPVTEPPGEPGLLLDLEQARARRRAAS